jgi:hypothetical protein
MDRSRKEKSQGPAKDKQLPRSLMARLAALAREDAFTSDKKQPGATAAARGSRRLS